jgi:DNA-binding transcriptional MerR regulator
MGENRDKPTLKIGELAKRFGLNVRTIRYYEAIGLLPVPARTEGGYRLYSEGDAERLAFVLQAKRVGFSLEEIQRIVRLGEHGSACEYVRETLSRHIAEVEARIAELQRLRAELVAAASAWQEPRGPKSGHVCGLIEGWAPSPQTVEHPPRRKDGACGGTLSTTDKEEEMTTPKRKVDIFTAGCPVCDPVVELVKRIACGSCEVAVHNVKDDPKAAERARSANVQRLPMVLVDGKPADCCQAGAVTEAGLRAAGIGAA